MQNFLIVFIGCIIGVILIQVRSYKNKKSSLPSQRSSNKIRNNNKQLQQQNQQSQENGEQIQKRDFSQQSQNLTTQQNQLEYRMQSLDRKQAQINKNSEDSIQSNFKYRDDMQIQQRERRNLNSVLKTPVDGNQKKDSLISSNSFNQFKEPFTQQNLIHQPQVTNNNHLSASNYQIVQQKIFSLYDISCRSRKSDKIFLGSAIISKDFSYLSIDDQIKQQLKLFLKGYRQVRGDGNCYFTAIAFQYFEILLNKFNYLEFEEVINQIEMMDFLIQYDGYFLESKLQNLCAKRLVQLLKILRDNPSQLELMMANPKHEFYGLAIIFFRNLSQLLYLRQNSQIIGEYKPDLSNELLTWEFQCNDSEMINSSLAKYLNIIINVYLIDKKNIEVTQLKYGQQSKNEIHLIYIPGHYDIGIPI
ncbi:unnamed protein product [Paramecium sonneborni]|uniref:Uncharacterized protein n=1 Tax=Paramecium sonneborni TaxID=65129 RepID=A0A8S1LWR0_9CILI|nr:unnamed protein product [Paramecium sonneborni]